MATFEYAKNIIDNNPKRLEGGVAYQIKFYKRTGKTVEDYVDNIMNVTEASRAFTSSSVSELTKSMRYAWDHIN
jgi:hypothetical protein